MKIELSLTKREVEAILRPDARLANVDGSWVYKSSQALQTADMKLRQAVQAAYEREQS